MKTKVEVRKKDTRITQKRERRKTTVGRDKEAEDAGPEAIRMTEDFSSSTTDECRQDGEI